MIVTVGKLFKWWAHNWQGVTEDDQHAILFTSMCSKDITSNLSFRKIQKQ